MNMKTKEERKQYLREYYEKVRKLRPKPEPKKKTCVMCQKQYYSENPKDVRGNVCSEECKRHRVNKSNKKYKERVALKISKDKAFNIEELKSFISEIERKCLYLDAIDVYKLTSYYIDIFDDYFHDTKNMEKELRMYYERIKEIIE